MTHPFFSFCIFHRVMFHLSYLVNELLWLFKNISSAEYSKKNNNGALTLNKGTFARSMFSPRPTTMKKSSPPQEHLVQAIHSLPTEMRVFWYVNYGLQTRTVSFTHCSPRGLIQPRTNPTQVQLANFVSPQSTQEKKCCTWCGNNLMAQYKKTPFQTQNKIPENHVCALLRIRLLFLFYGN